MAKLQFAGLIVILVGVENFVGSNDIIVLSLYLHRRNCGVRIKFEFQELLLLGPR